MSVSSPIQSDSSFCVKHTHTDIRVLFGGTLVCVVSVSSPIRKGTLHPVPEKF